MKNLKIKLLLLFLMSCVFNVVHATRIEVENEDGVSICYNFINNNTELEVTYRGKYFGSASAVAGDDEYVGDVRIPETVVYAGKTYNVTCIGEWAFGYNYGVVSVSIPKSIKRINSDAFTKCPDIKIIIPNLESWFNLSFGGVIGDGYRLYLEENTEITDLVIPSSVVKINEHAFAGCISLKSVYIPNNVTTIGNIAIADDLGLVVVNTGPFYCCRNLESVSFSNSVTMIGDYAFCGCSSLTSIEIPNSVNTIGISAFSGCTGLTSVEIPNSVTSIGAFAGCTGLTSIEIPNSVTSIDYGAFSGCTGLTSVTIPNSVTSIGYEAFYGCTGLTSIEIPNSVTSIGIYAFRYCTGLTSITIPNSVTSIGYEAFRYCTGLTSIEIPNSVTTIGEWAFADCSGLTSVEINSNAILSKSYESYSSLNDVFGNLVQNYIIGNDVTSIGDYAFAGCTGLTSIEIPNSVTTIGEGAFAGCTGLTSIEIPNSVTTIGAFAGCTGLTSIEIPNSVTSIGNYAFSDCSGLTSVTIPNSVTSIGKKAFYSCASLKSFNVGSGVKTIGQEALTGCSSLTNLISAATEPPVCDTNALTNINKFDCTLTIPEGTLAAYQAAVQWRDFFFIEEKDLTGITTIEKDGINDCEIIGVYDLNGYRIDTLQRGMNIIKTSDGKTKKVMIK